MCFDDRKADFVVTPSTQSGFFAIKTKLLHSMRLQLQRKHQRLNFFAPKGHERMARGVGVPKSIKLLVMKVSQHSTTRFSKDPQTPNHITYDVEQKEG